MELILEALKFLQAVFTEYHKLFSRKIQKRTKVEEPIPDTLRFRKKMRVSIS
jgi:hypothetical protein